jgi:hypothetical protein
MQQIEHEITQVEQRLAQRRLKVELLARATGRRAVHSLVSPAGLLGAATLGFIAVAGVLRRPRHQVVQKSGKGGILGSLAGLAATVGFQLLRAQFGSPAQMAQKLAAMWKSKSLRGDIRQAQHRAPFGG